MIASAIATTSSAQVLRVDDDQTSATQNGLSWATAYPRLEQALAEALVKNTNGMPGDDISEIWVAQGRYEPTTNPTDRTASFELLPGVSVYGGFDGTETSRAARAGLFDQTLLSGDIDANPATIAQNSYHVVLVDGAIVGGSLTGHFRLDGFRVMFGAAVSGSPFLDQTIGGGALVRDVPLGTEVVIANTRFESCFAVAGGGLFAKNSAYVGLVRSSFVSCVGYSATPDGSATPPTGVGGGMGATGCKEVYAYNTAFTNNRASYGGGAWVQPSGSVLEGAQPQMRFVNCLLAQNTAIAGGGAAVWSSFNTPAVFDFCTIANNTASSVGDVPPPTLRYGGAGIHTFDGSHLAVRSSIIWGNVDQNSVADSIGGAGIGSGPAPVTVVTYSDVALPGGAVWSTPGSSANINQDPLFVSASTGNFRISANSPCIDVADDIVLHSLVGAPNYGPAPTSEFTRSLGDILDVDEDGVFETEYLPLDLDLLNREMDISTVPNGPRDFAISNFVADMGCYEYPLGIP
ncbi:MAG: hypothetical protein R3F49_04840 [Planctomycetota bacterium]